MTNAILNSSANLSLAVFLFSLALNAGLALPLINFLYKHRFYKTKDTAGVDTSNRNQLWYAHLGKSLDTPSSFGVLLLVNILLYLPISFLIYGKAELLLLVLSSTILLLLGLWDDCEKYFRYLSKKRWGLRIRHKLLIQILAVIIFIIPSYESLYWLPVALFLIFTINAYNITDGLDGLIGGVSIPVFVTLCVVEYLTFGFTGYFILGLTLIGFLCVFQYFNVKPARVWLGDVGALPLGLLLGAFLLRYPSYFSATISVIFVIEGLSSALQLLSLGVLKKKLFLIAPFHLLLLNVGWSDTKIVQRAQLIQIILCILAFLGFLAFR